MQLLPMQEVIGQIQAGQPLPWGVRDVDGNLLLARGHAVDAAMLKTLLARGMFVDAAEAARVNGAVRAATAPRSENFFGRWRMLQSRLNTMLQKPPPDLQRAIEEVITVLIGMADRDPDKMLFQIMRHDQGRLQLYSITHALHCAAVCCLTSRRMAWEEPRRRSLVGAALTMNLSMIELQGRLAGQVAPPTPEQRAEIHSHPLRSAAMLRAAGFIDEDWLVAVEQHHETADGKGYPAGVADMIECAQMLNFADVFTAKLCARASRSAMLSNQVARDIFTENQGHPMAAALIKELGLYPPGCFVQLQSGETAIVVRRGDSMNTPHVACLTNRNGDTLTTPLRRDTSKMENSVIALTPDSNVMVRIPWETLYDD